MAARSAQQMLRQYSALRARAHPVKAAEKGVASTAEGTAEKWHALQHLFHKLQSLEASKGAPAGGSAHEEAGPSTGDRSPTQPTSILFPSPSTCWR